MKAIHRLIMLIALGTADLCIASGLGTPQNYYNLISGQNTDTSARGGVVTASNLGVKLWEAAEPAAISGTTAKAFVFHVRTSEPKLVEQLVKAGVEPNYAKRQAPRILKVCGSKVFKGATAAISVGSGALALYEIADLGNEGTDSSRRLGPTDDLADKPADSRYWIAGLAAGLGLVVYLLLRHYRRLS